MKQLSFASTTYKYLEEKGIQVSQGCMVDATIIHSPNSIKSQEKQRDPDMSLRGKGKQYHFGMPVHIGTDVNSQKVEDSALKPESVDYLNGLAVR